MPTAALRKDGRSDAAAISIGSASLTAMAELAKKLKYPPGWLIMTLSSLEIPLPTKDGSGLVSSSPTSRPTQLALEESVPSRLGERGLTVNVPSSPLIRA